MDFQGALIVSLFLSIVCICTAVNFQWDDGPCTGAPIIFGVQKDVNINQFTSDSNKTAYLPLLSRYELYKSASMLTGISIDDLTEDDIKNSCITFTQEGTGFTMRGFKDKQMEIVSEEPGKDGGFLWKLKGELNYRGKTWIIYATKDLFTTIAVTCWTNGHRSFAVSNRKKTIDKKALQIIEGKLLMAGFQPKYFYDYDYNNCDLTD